MLEETRSQNPLYTRWWRKPGGMRLTEFGITLGSPSLTARRMTKTISPINARARVHKAERSSHADCGGDAIHTTAAARGAFSNTLASAAPSNCHNSKTTDVITK